MHRRTLAALGLAAPFLSIRGLRAEASVRIGWLRSLNILSLVKARGTLERALAEQGIALEWAASFGASAPAVEALNAGSIDITTGSTTSAIASLTAQVPMVIFAYRQTSPGAEGIVVRADLPIQNMADLAGRSVAVNRGGTGEYLLVHGLQKHGVDLRSVTRNYLPPPEAGMAFAGGRVDAWATWDPYLAGAIAERGGRLLADGAALGNENANVVIATRRFATERRAVLKTIYDTLIAESRWAEANQLEAAGIWTRELRLSPDLIPRLGPTNALAYGPVGRDQTAQVKRIADWYVANRIVPPVRNVEAAMLDLAA
jgi:sulfonate transport system substrate-binding protein